jgi:predicted Zn-dependent peptidase
MQSRLLTATIAGIMSLSLAACATMPAAQNAAAETTGTPIAQASLEQQAAPLAELVGEVDIPYDSFTLENGLTTLVHTDRKSPVVGVTVYYRVGSKHEPRGRTGFAHLFEHLMFGGSENVENFDVPLEAAGSTSTNGSTWYDRTNYVETVPTGALDLALFMESDRMGHLLGAVTQDKLDKQRGVVQNEKRQGDNQPYGLEQYAIAEGLLPVGHPYRHSTIGSMADLDAASLADVRKWFIDNYGPNNVVLALAGDIDAASARPKVERWFGDIPRGPDVAQVAAAPVTLNADVSREITDQVPLPRIYRAWTGPAMTDPDGVPLVVGMSVLGGLVSSRLDNILVRDEQLAVSVAAYAQQHEQLSMLQVQMDVKPGVDRAVAEARLDEIIAEYIATGPTAEEVRRAATQTVSGQIGALERVGGFGGKGATLAEGLLYASDPAFYKKEFARLAALSPADVQAALQRWLSRPVYKLAIVPGERTLDGADMGGWGDEDTMPAPQPDAREAVAAVEQGPPRTAPPVADVAPLTLPEISRATLNNGIPVTLARRTSVPKAIVSVNFDAGYAADGQQGAGTQSLMMALLEEGTATRNARAIAEAQELLGASLSTGTGQDTSAVTLDALTANLEPSLALMADVVRNPAFRADDVARLKDQRLAAIAQQLASPMGLATRALGPLVYGESHPYGTVGSLGEVSVIEGLDPARLQAEHRAWIRPSTANITVVGDVTMAELLPALNATFGNWPDTHMAVLQKPLDVPVPVRATSITAIDRPNSPQSVVMVARALDLTGRDQGHEALDLANEVLGGGFLSRLNLLIREEKGWSYGARSGVDSPLGQRLLVAYSPVQADRTGDSLQLVLDTMREFASGERTIDETEFQRVTDGQIRGLPNSFQTNGQVLGALITNQRLGRPDDYLSNLPQILGAVDAEAIDAAAAQYFAPQNLTIVVVGDRDVIEDQLAGLGLPVNWEPVDTAVSSNE